MATSRKPPAKSGAAVLRQVRDMLANGWPAGLTVLTGEDAYHLDAAQKTILGSLVPRDTTEFALTVFGEDKVGLPAVVAAARSMGMFAPRRVVLVRELDALEGEPDVLRDYADSPPPASHLMVRAPVLDKRKKLHKLLSTAGTTLRFERGAGGQFGDLLREVAEFAGERELRLERGVAEFLLEISSFDLYGVTSELDKLSAWAGGRGERRVSLDDAREIAAAGGAMTGWEVAHALLARDGAAAMAAARRNLEAGAEPILLLGGLAYYVRTLLRAKAMQGAGRNEREILQATRAWHLKDGLRLALRRYTLDELMTFPYHLAEADRAFKSRSIDSGAVFEDLVSRLVTGHPVEAR